MLKNVTVSQRLNHNLTSDVLAHTLAYSSTKELLAVA